MFDAIITYLKGTADCMDENGLKYLTATDLRRLALEMAAQGYEEYDEEDQ
jgi:tRNA G26 N,N-dimethylase Trm1